MGLDLRHLGHNFLHNLWDIIAVSAEPKRYLSTSISRSLSIVLSELLVWIVESTKWPVIDALTAILAVSSSRISPIIIMLGSCLKIERSVVLKSKPISLITCTWFKPFIFISTGSSTVIMFVCGVLSSWSIE